MHITFRKGFKTEGTVQAKALSDSPRARNQRSWDHTWGSLSLFPLAQNASTPKLSLWLRGHLLLRVKPLDLRFSCVPLREPHTFIPGSLSSISFFVGANVSLLPLPVFLEGQNEGVLQRMCSHSGLGLSVPCLILGSGSSEEGFRLP